MKRKNTFNKILVGFVFFVILLFASLYLYNRIMTDIENKKYPAIGETVNLGTHSLHYISQGVGDIPVILDAGLPGTCLHYSFIMDGLSEYAQVVAYDRAGYGWSEAGPEPRTSLKIVNELHQLLEKVNIKKPYILVGHSFGGMNMLLYTHIYPEEVAGLVLIDSTHPEYKQYLPSEFQSIEKSKLSQLKMGALLSNFGIQRILNISMSPYELPDHLIDTGKTTGFKASAFQAAYNEYSVMDISLEQVKQVDSIGDIPLLILTKGLDTPQLQGFSKEQMIQYESGLDQLQQKFLILSTDSKQIIAEESGHSIHYDQPKLVIQSIKEIIDKVKE